MIQISPNIFDHILESVLITDSNMNVIYANTIFSNLVEISSRRLTSETLRKLFPVDELVKKKSIIQESEIKLDEKRVIRIQLCVEEILIDNKPSWIFFIHDISVEEALLGKYKKQLKKHESYIRRLDRKLFDMTFLLEISSLLNKKSRGAEVFSQALTLISTVFGLDKVALIQINGMNINVCASCGLPAEDRFWSKTLSEVVPNVTRITNTTSKNIVGNLIYEKEGNLIPDDQQLLQSVANQFFSRLEQEILYSSSITDGKTGLYNAQHLQTCLKEEIEKAKQRKENLGLIVVDIDFFKKFNDTYGHQTGDLVLVHVAQQIRSATRTSDIAARFGGEEFCVLAIKTTLEGMKKVMERIRSFIADNPLVSEEHGALKVTASVGAALYPVHGETPEELFSNADKALYLCKSTGRNKAIIFDEKKI